MSYPFTTYLSSADDKTKLRPVVVTGYTDAISLGAFRKNMLYALMELLPKYKTYDIYNHLPTVEKDLWEIEDDSIRIAKYGLAPTYSVVGDPVNLMDYYKEVGYDYKTKKFHGKTVRQYIKHKMTKT